MKHLLVLMGKQFCVLCPFVCVLLPLSENVRWKFRAAPQYQILGQTAQSCRGVYGEKTSCSRVSEWQKDFDGQLITRIYWSKHQRIQKLGVQWVQWITKPLFQRLQLLSPSQKWYNLRQSAHCILYTETRLGKYVYSSQVMLTVNTKPLKINLWTPQKNVLYVITQLNWKSPLNSANRHVEDPGWQAQQKHSQTLGVHTEDPLIL